MMNYRANPKLPPATTNWGARRKAAVVKGIRAGAITRDEACALYLLSLEELAAWEIGFDQAGTAGLSTKGSLQRRERNRGGPAAGPNSAFVARVLRVPIAVHQSFFR
jgi:Protein of unknown function (DUF1153)